MTNEEKEETEQALVNDIETARQREALRVGRILDEASDCALESWVNGYKTAVEFARRLGGIALAYELEATLDAYWRSQGVED